MSDRYLRNTTTNKLVEFVTDDAVIAPAGHDFISKATIAAAYTGEILLGGLWNGTAYTRPTGQPTKLDLTTALGRFQATVLAMQEQFFDNLYPRIQAEAPNHPDHVRSIVLDAVLGQLRGVYIKMKDSTISLPLRISYVTTAVFGPTEVTDHGTPVAVRKLFEAGESLTFAANWVSGRPLSFIVLNTAGDAYVRRSFQASINASVTDFRTPPSFVGVDLTDSAWIHAITA